jgi:hypothetical protein
VFLGLAALVACGPAEGVEVEPLPPLERPSAEERAGLPMLTGVWRFAGWEVGGEEAAAALGEPGSPGDIQLTAQRVDSLAGYLVRGEQRIPLVGELRRDGVAALVARDGDAAFGYLAGQVAGDTLVIRVASLDGSELASPGRGLIYVRGPVGQRIVRGADGRLLRDTAVLVAADTAAARPAAPAIVTPEAGTPAPEPARSQPADPRPVPADTPPPTPQPDPDPPQPQPQPEPQPEPAPPPEPAPAGVTPPDFPVTDPVEPPA